MYIAVLVIFFGIMAVVSLVLSKRITSSSSMTLGDKSIPWYVNAGTLIATYVGSGALVGGAALAFKVGYNAIWLYAGGWIAIGCLLLMSSRIRRFAGTTTSEFLGARYGSKARTMAALIVILAESAVVGYNIRGTGWVINILTGMNLGTATILATILIIAFTVIAGFVSVAYTDYLQGIVIIISLFIALPFAINGVGGWQAIRLALPAENLQPLQSFSLYNMLATGLPTLALVFMGQSFWQRLFAANSPGEAKKASVWWFFGVVTITFAIMTIAVVGSVMFPDVAPDSIIMVMAKDGIPPFIGVFLMAGCAAILVTSANSFLLAACTTFFNDIFEPFFGKNLSEKAKINVIRITILVFGILAFVQVQFFPTILAMVFYAYTMEGGLTIPALGAFFWKRASSAGGVASIIAVGATTVLWQIYKPFGIAPIFATLIAGTVALIAVSLMTQPPSKEVLARFEGLSKTD